MRFTVLLLLGSAFLAACGTDENFERQAKKTPQVECSLTRITGGPVKTVKVKFEVSDDIQENSKRLNVFAGSYSFSVFGSAEAMDVIINEDNIVLDEIGSFGCGEIPKKKQQFCAEEITVDKNLGVDGAKEVEVKAFNFFCQRL